MFDYFYGLQAEQFAFYRVPKILFTHEAFRMISAEAKTLYGILLDRMNLSARNGWVDEAGRVYIIFTLDEIMEALGCAKQKAVKLLDELEAKACLIERKRQGLCKPNLIYVKNFITGVPKSNFRKFENHTSGGMNITTQEVSKSYGNNTDQNDTDENKTDLISSKGRISASEEIRVSYERYFRRSLEIEMVKEKHPEQRETVDGILDLLVDTCCSNREWIMISGDRKPIEIVKSRFMKLTMFHLEYVLDSLAENTTRIRNVNQYLLASLFNAPSTISPYYQSCVNNDIAYGRI